EECNTRHLELEKNIHQVKKQYTPLCTVAIAVPVVIQIAYPEPKAVAQ
ncbi:unnamed protein product, partial [Rotaria sp. Silwood1]